MQNTYLAIVLSPLLGSLIAGLFGHWVGRRGAHTVTILGVFISCILSCQVLYLFITDQTGVFNENLYTWAMTGDIGFHIGFLVDRLTAVMMVVVTFVSLMVHIYTIGYMHEDPGYQRFFSYISLFTFAMLMLVMANNFLQLFFGWEAVGLVSYLLIGFWFKKETAIFANLKAFLVNRVGDFGFLLGIAGVLMVFGSLDYMEVFKQVPQVAESGQTFSLISGSDWSVMTVICILLFIGAMGKSAQVPLHVWLPDSMEGPTPISALIHAATMVTAGVFMVARMSPLYEYSEVALSVVLVIGSITALFMGFLGIIQNDIKRVVAYSTLSQLGYMMVALGASAYAAGIFHLMTHAFFKALLFLAAGSVIVALHHEQDIRNMGNLKKYMPITYFTSLVGSLALIGFPGFSGFYSKDAIIEAVHASTIPGAGFAYFAVLLGVVVTAFYSFRMFFLVFHTNERIPEHAKAHCHEPSWVIWLPLVLLAIPSVGIAWFSVEPMLFKDFFRDAIVVLPQHNVLGEVKSHFHGPLDFALHAFVTPPFWLAMFGVLAAWVFFVFRPRFAVVLKEKFHWIYKILEHKYGFDEFNQTVLAGGSRLLGRSFWRYSDMKFIDGWLVNGSAKAVKHISGMIRHMQTGFIYHYAFAMILGLIALLYWIVWM